MANDEAYLGIVCVCVCVAGSLPRHSNYTYGVSGVVVVVVVEQVACVYWW